MQSYPSFACSYRVGPGTYASPTRNASKRGGILKGEFATQLLQRRVKIVDQPEQYFARHIGRDRPAGVAVFLAVARESDFAATADEQLVVASPIVVALRRVAAELHNAALGVELNWADRLH